MSDYTKTVDFASKDALASGNPLKAAKGAEVDNEFDNIATAIATKYDINDRNVANGLAPLDSEGLLPDANLSVNIPRLDTTNTFTAQNSGSNKTILLSSGFPSLGWNETDAAADNRLWDISPSAGQFRIRAIDDASSAATNFFCCRS